MKRVEIISKPSASFSLKPKQMHKSRFRPRSFEPSETEHEISACEGAPSFSYNLMNIPAYPPVQCKEPEEEEEEKIQAKSMGDGITQTMQSRADPDTEDEEALHGKLLPVQRKATHFSYNLMNLPLFPPVLRKASKEEEEIQAKPLADRITPTVQKRADATGDRIRKNRETYDGSHRNITFFTGDTGNVIQREIVRGKELDNMDLDQLQDFYEEALAGGFDEAEIMKIDAAMSAIRKSKGLQYRGYDPDNYDLTYNGRQIRFSFNQGLRADLINKQMVGKDLICLHCNQPIILKNGKEVWQSQGGNWHETAPPIDHHKPSWKRRLDGLMNKGYDVQTFQTMGQKLYNDPPLRILHMRCNSSLGGNH
jgi:hypothetical protein